MRGVTIGVAVAGFMLLAITLEIKNEAESQVEAMWSLVHVYRDRDKALRGERDRAKAELEVRPFQTKTYTVYFPCQSQPRPIPRVTPIFSRDSQTYAGGF